MIMPKVIVEQQKGQRLIGSTAVPMIEKMKEIFKIENAKCLGFVITFTLCIGSTWACRGGTLIRTGVSPDEKVQILETHNRLRSTVAQGRVPNQPGAENMQEMVWDDELAIKAQQWANQCTFQHDPSRYLNRFTMGQNLAIIWSTIPLADDDGDFPSRIQNWFNEVQKYAWGAQWSPATGHYSQLVWGETNLIGCGFSYYKDNRRYNKLWVCNYGPGGNVIGSVPYEVGQPACQNYGMHPSARYSGLCSSFRQTSSDYNVQNNFISQNTYTFKSERFNPPTYQAPDKIVNVFAQALPHQTANGNFNTNFPIKSVFDKVRSVFQQPQQQQQNYQLQTNTYNYQPTGTSVQTYQQSAQYQQQQNNYQQQSVYVQQQPTVQPTYQQQQQQPQQQQQQQQQQQPQQQQSYQQNHQTYQKQSYQQQAPQKQRTLDELRKAAFLSYDWSQLFSPNFRFRSK